MHRSAVRRPLLFPKRASGINVWKPEESSLSEWTSVKRLGVGVGVKKRGLKGICNVASVELLTLTPQVQWVITQRR